MSLLAASKASSEGTISEQHRDASTCIEALVQIAETWPSAGLCAKALTAVRETLLARPSDAIFPCAETSSCAQPAATLSSKTEVGNLHPEASRVYPQRLAVHSDSFDNDTFCGLLEAFWEIPSASTTFGWQGLFQDD